MARRKIYIGGSYPHKWKFYSNIFTQKGVPFKTSVTVSIGDDHMGGVNLTLVYWDNGEKIIRKDFVAGSSTTTLDIEIGNPTSVPPFILYAESTGIGALPLTIDSGYDLSPFTLNQNDNDILLETGSKNPTLSYEELNKILDKANNISKQVKNSFRTAERQTSPLVLDLNGDGVNTVSAENGVYFDHDGNEFAERTGWVSAEDGLLVRDINGNGLIDDGTELFGNNSVLSSGKKAANGFEALADLDSNNDGVFNNQDTAWNEVKVWKDGNSNGVVDEGELLTLEQAGVSGVNLDYQKSSITDENGNQHRQQGSFIKTDGTFGAIDDVWFDANNSDTIDKTTIDVAENILLLPDIRGFGNVHNLHIAMALDESGTLKSLVEQYIATPSIEARKGLIDDIIFHWTGVQDIDPLSRKPSYFSSNPIKDARYLEALEQFMGEKYSNHYWFGREDENPHEQASKILLQAYDKLSLYVMNELEAQTHCKTLLENIKLKWNDEKQSWSVDITGAAEILNDIAMTDFNKAVETLHLLEDIIAQKQTLADSINSAFQNKSQEVGELQMYFLNFGKFENKISDKNDIIYGTNDDNYINGCAGNDKIYAGAGDDILVGGAGNDYLVGGEGSDTYFFEGSWGKDSIDNFSIEEKGAHPDKILFGEGITPQDVTIKRNGNDLILSLHDGADTVKVYSYFLNAGETTNTVDTIEFADGTIWDYNYVRVAWNAAPQAEGDFTTINGTNEDDTISGTSGNDLISGERGNDTIKAGAGNDLIYGGRGDDILSGGTGDDTYIWNLGDGFDTITDTGNNDVISFGKGITFEDLKFSGQGKDLRIIVNNNPTQGILIKKFFEDLTHKIEELVFTNGEKILLSEIPLTMIQDDTADTVYATTFGDTIYGNGGNDIIYGGNGDDTIYGGDGDDTITGGNGMDTIIGGRGNDIIDGNIGADTYVWNLGDDLDTIKYVSSIDTIKFGPGITFEDLTFRNDNGDLRIYVKGDETQGVICKGFFNDDDKKSKEIMFDDGSTFALPTSGLTLVQKDTAENITATKYDDVVYGNAGDDIIHTGNGNDTVYGGTGNDNLYGENGDDIIAGNTGDDYMEGGAGNDTYIYNLGDGLDTIYDKSGTDKIIFGDGIKFSDFTYRAEGNNLRMILNGNEKQGIIINNFFSGNDYKIETLEFADGSEVAFNQIGFELNQNSQTKDLTVTLYDDIVHLLDTPSNSVNVGAGNDVVYGGDYNDKITGDTGDDILYGGAGNDTIYGDNDTSSYKYVGNDTLIGGEGDDYLAGGYGNDTYVYNLGDGLDTIYDTSGIDTIKFGEEITLDNFTYRAEGNNLRMILNGDETQGIIIQDYFNGKPIENIELSDGTIIDFTKVGFELDQNKISNNLTLTENDDIIHLVPDYNNINTSGGNDIIYGNIFADTIDGGAGDDVIYGDDGNDKLIGHTGDDILYGGNGNDTIYGDNDTSSYKYVGNDTLIGGAGNDYLSGGYGNDTYIYNLNDGLDTIYDNKGTDKIVFGEGIEFENISYRAEGNNLRMILNGDENQGIIINNFFSSDDYKIETLEFADGKTVAFNQIGFELQQNNQTNGLNTTNYDDIIHLFDTPSNSVNVGAGNDVAYGGAYNDTIIGHTGNDILYGGSGNDTIYGDNDTSSSKYVGNDTLIGGEGNDYLAGGYGDDTYVYNLGDGLDTIYDTNGTDTLKFGEGITLENFTYRAEGNNLRMILNGDENQGIIIQDYFNGKPIENIELSDGTIIDFTKVGFELNQNKISSNLTLTDNDDIIHLAADYNNINTSGGNDIVYGNIFADTIVGGTGDDILYGGSGNDTIYGDNDTSSSKYVGNDTLIGGKGNDYLAGGYGDDTYLYNLNDGFDTIYDTKGNDKIIFGEGINATMLSLEQSGNNLRILVNNDKDQGIQINEYFNNADRRIESIEFSNGQTIDISNADQLIQAMNTFGISNSATSDSLSCTAENINDMCNLAVNDLNKKAV